jgi:putative ABC transport system ATP-binding protein
MEPLYFVGVGITICRGMKGGKHVVLRRPFRATTGCPYGSCATNTYCVGAVFDRPSLRVTTGHTYLLDKTRPHLRSVVILWTKRKNGHITDYCVVPSGIREGKQMGTPLVVAKNLQKLYLMGEVTVHALRGVDFTLYDGELVVILGPSGSGKSTLLNIVGGMDTATGGELYFREKALHKATEKELTLYRRREVGFIFQFYNLMPSLTASENIGLSAQIAREPLDVDELLQQVGLQDRRDHFPAQLSGGEQQRVAIARALAKNPRMLLCDEPTGALDLAAGMQVLQMLRNFCSRFNKTVVLITHNRGIAPLADRIVYLRDGMIDQVEVNAHPIPPEGVSW